MSIRILRPGLLTTIQDTGRFGYQQQGVIVSGAMDAFALRIANLLVGNAEDEAALEITLMGPSLRFEADLLISICGGNLSPAVDGNPVPLWRPVYVRSGTTLEFGACRTGARAYLAVSGGFDVPIVMRSRSTYLRAGIGGFEGRALQEGDVLRAGVPSAPATLYMTRLAGRTGSCPFHAADWFVGGELLPVYAPNPSIRVIRGHEFGRFAAESQALFLSGGYQVTPQSDRMGYRLKGPVLKLKESEEGEMLSEAVSFGTVQVPSDGNPIILMADCQTIGGYPKIAQVATVDLPVLAQVKPGETIRFAEISVQEAERLYLKRETDMVMAAKAMALHFKESR